MDDLEKILKATEEEKFPKAVQPFAEAIITDTIGAGSHMTNQIVKDNPELQRAVDMMLAHLVMVCNDMEDPDWQPSELVINGLKSSLNQIDNAIPEEFRHLCFLECRYLNNHMLEVEGARRFEEMNKTQKEDGVDLNGQWLAAGTAVVVKNITGTKEFNAVILGQDNDGDPLVEYIDQPSKYHEEGQPYSVFKSQIISVENNDLLEPEF